MVVIKPGEITTTTTTAAWTSFDCDHKWLIWKTAWSSEKKMWCCANYNRGCVRRKRFDCMAGLSTWREGWSAAKMEWCWENEHRGGPPTYECSGPRYDWSKAQGNWCCAVEGIGCSEARYRQRGYGSVLKANRKCGDFMPMPKTQRKERQLMSYVEGQVAAGRLGLTRTGLWLGAHWYEPRQRWEWNDNSPIGRALLQKYYTPSHHYGPRLRPFLFLKNGTWHDANADEMHDIVCEEPAEEELRVV